MKHDAGPGSLLFQPNTARNTCNSQSDSNRGIKHLLDKKRTTLKIEHMRFIVPEENELVSSTKRFFCHTVHFRTTLTLAIPVPQPEAAPDLGT